MDIFKKEKGRFDIIFTDVVLPDSNGLRLAEQLLMEESSIRVLFTSGYTDQKSQRHLIDIKGFSFLQKPYSFFDMLRTVKGVLQQVSSKQQKVVA